MEEEEEEEDARGLVTTTTTTAALRRHCFRSRHSFLQDEGEEGDAMVNCVVRRKQTDDAEDEPASRACRQQGDVCINCIKS